jgi:SAM-dependent methyltransferase
LSCKRCGRTYATRSGVFDFVLDPPPDEDVGERWRLWEQLERNGLVSYENDPEANLSIGARDDARAFFEFAELDGVVLDVGCGPQTLPSYARDFNGTLVGIDPLLGELPRNFMFVRGVGEYLPFRPESFDRVLFATSLDHALSPRRALSEAGRVVKPSGAIVLWFGEKHEPRDAPPRESVDWYERLSVPDGAQDPFHVVRFDRGLARAFVGEAGLTLVDTRVDGDGNVFMRARKG